LETAFLCYNLFDCGSSAVIWRMNMFRYSVVCALEEMPRGNPTLLFGEPDELAHKLTILGANAVELEISDPFRFDASEVKRAFMRELISVAAISTDLEYTKNGICLIEQNYIKRREHIEKLKGHIDFAQKLNCPVSIGMVRGMLPTAGDDYEIDRAVECFTESLCDLCDYAASKGVKIYLQALLRYLSNYLNSAGETISYAKSLGISNLGVSLDTHSMLMEEKDLAHELFLYAASIDHIRFSEGNRLCLGHGNVDFKKAMSALIDGGYDGYIGISALPYPDGMECARRSINYLRALESSLGPI